jgi:hypothetical protein
MCDHGMCSGILHPILNGSITRILPTAMSPLPLTAMPLHTAILLRRPPPLHMQHLRNHGMPHPPPMLQSYPHPGYEPQYGVNSSRTRHFRSGTPPNGSSDSGRSKEHEGRDENQRGKGVRVTDNGISIVTTCVPATAEDDIAAGMTPTASPVAPLKVPQ